jgi:hypothetical protein
MRVELSPEEQPQHSPAGSDVVRRSRVRLAMRQRRRVATSAGLAACFAFGCVLTYTKGMQAIDEILSNRPKPVLTPVAAAAPGGRQARQIPLNADHTPVASISAPVETKPPPTAPFRPVERAPGFSGFEVIAGR